jgi:hypothetical protein
VAGGAGGCIPDGLLGGSGGEVTAQEALALAEPLVLLTVTVKLCVPTARPE